MGRPVAEYVTVARHRSGGRHLYGTAVISHTRLALIGCQMPGTKLSVGVSEDGKALVLTRAEED